MRRLLFSTAMTALVAIAAGPGDAMAQSSTIIRSPAAGGGMVTSGGMSGATYDASTPVGQIGRLEDRINELEDILRQLTGKVEEANFKTAQMAKQLERMQADIDLRFKDLGESGRPSSAASSSGAAALPATTSSGAPLLIPPKGSPAAGANSAEGTGPAPGPMPLGAIADKDLRKAQAAAPSQPPAAPKDPQSAYDEAYGLAQKGDYDGAERGFQAFLKAYPTHSLSGNAQYWLGDIAYSQRKDFAQAARLFGEAYKKYPKHTKAPDMLYKLGASFGQLEMKDQACRAYSLLFAEHPDMPDRVKRAAGADRQRLGCK